MAEHVLQSLFFRMPRSAFWSTFGIRRQRKRYAMNEQEDSRSRREFVMEMLDRNPDAFSSELDIQHMARLYRSKF